MEQRTFTEQQMNTVTLAGSTIKLSAADLEKRRLAIIERINEALANPKITREQHNALIDHKNSLLKQ